VASGSSSSSFWGRLGGVAGRLQAAPLLEDLRIERVVLVSFVASRVLLLVAAVLAEAVVPHGRSLAPGDGAPILASLTSWDGWWYLEIARDGYHAEAVRGPYHDTAFAPLYPALIGALSAPWPAFAGLVVVVLSNVLLLAGLGLLTTLGAMHLSRERAALAAALLAIYPFASVFGMAYTESLFLVLMVAAFLVAERGHRAWMGVLLALAVLTRLQGIALVLPFAVLLVKRDGWRVRASQAWLFLPVVAAIGFIAFVALVSGSATAYLDAMAAWGKAGVGSGSADQAIGAAFSLEQAALLATLLGSVFLLVFARKDRIPPEYLLIPVVFIGAAIATGSLESVGRYTMLAFPLSWILASRRTAISRGVWPVISAVLFTLIAVLSFALYWVP
jgi:hypothetical protein